jgi:hypothetical protein
MKKLLTVICIAFSTVGFSQTKNDIVFKEMTHSFGKVKQNVPVTYVFSFTNNSSKPAVIEFVNPDCGCTTPEYSKDPILKGKSSNIKVTYNAATPGTFKKNVNIKFASIELPIVITIDGEVVSSANKKSGK